MNNKKIDNKIKKLDKKEKQIDKKIKEVKELTRKQRLFLKTKESARKFRQELKKSTNTAIIAAFGFIIALAWRDVITEYVNKITEASPIQGKLISAIIITIMSVIGILIITTLFSRQEE